MISIIISQCLIQPVSHILRTCECWWLEGACLGWCWLEQPRPRILHSTATGHGHRLVCRAELCSHQQPHHTTTLNSTTTSCICNNTDSTIALLWQWGRGHLCLRISWKQSYLTFKFILLGRGRPLGWWWWFVIEWSPFRKHNLMCDSIWNARNYHQISFWSFYVH